MLTNARWPIQIHRSGKQGTRLCSSGAMSLPAARPQILASFTSDVQKRLKMPITT